MRKEEAAEECEVGFKVFDPFQIFYFTQNIPKNNTVGKYCEKITQRPQRPFRHGHAT